ncbi:MAG: hypothetical protein ACLUIX_07575 [Oscillospiraceae bacterium]
MRSCAAVTLVLMLLLFGIPWLAEAPEGGQAQPEPLAAEERGRMRTLPSPCGTGRSCGR